MIEFNINDENLQAIKAESKLYNLKTKHDYRVYGLKKKINPPILISCDATKIDENFEKQIKAFFKKNNLIVEIEDDEDDKNRIYIGLRNDVREYIVLTAAIIQTLIYAIEGKLELNSEYSIGKMPKFNDEIGEPLVE